MSQNTDFPKTISSESVEENIQMVLEHHAREEKNLGKSQKILEEISTHIDRPIFIYIYFLFIILWVLSNVTLSYYDLESFDPSPFPLLQGIVGLSALFAVTIVLSKQNRLIKIDEQRSHLHLKVTLLTEQKTAKLIELLEELRNDLPNVRNRVDPLANSLQEPIKADEVTTTLNEIKDQI